LLPTLEIKAREVALCTQAYELLIFTSVNAVKHGSQLLAAQLELANTNGVPPLIAVIGTATAAALTQLGHRVDITPKMMSSEGLLAEPALQVASQRVLIVRGQGGRELLRETLTQRGCTVEVCEVYERVAAQPDAAQLEAAVQLLRNGELDVISITSVDTLSALDALLPEPERQLAHRVPLLAGSARIAAEAKALGWNGETIVSANPEDKELLGALMRWYTRARN